MLKPKDLCGIPWRVAFALQADRWWLRSAIIWAKGISFCPTYSGSCMPGSQQDRPTTSHENVFLLSKKPRYFYDNEAVREAHRDSNASRLVALRKHGPVRPPEQVPGSADSTNPHYKQADYRGLKGVGTTFGTFNPAGRTPRTVWTINPGNFKGSHFAVFPPKLVEPMIKAGTSAKGVCPECGAPHVRVTERGPLSGEAVIQDTERPAASIRNVSGSSILRTNGRTFRPTKTTGWRPACSHYDALYYSDFPKPKNPRKRAQRAASGNWFKRARKRPGLDRWPVEPATVLDPFAGSGTTLAVADSLNRHSVGIELSEMYCREHIIPRLTEPLFEWAEQEQPEIEPEPQAEQLELAL